MRSLIEKISKASFIIFLIFILIYSFSSRPNKFSGDLDVLVQGKFWTASGVDTNNDGSVDMILYKHPYPILGVILFAILPKNFFLLTGPFALVLSYLLIYWKVSKRIIYLYPLTILNPLYFYTFTTRTFDWLLLPIVYDRLKKDRDFQATILGAAMVYIHGVIPLFYLVVVFAYLKKQRQLVLLVIMTLPQLIPLLYFSQGYAEFWSQVPGVTWKPIFLGRRYLLTLSNLSFRVISALAYLITFLSLIIWERRIKIGKIQ